MKRFSRVLVAAAALGGLACSEGPTVPSAEMIPPAEPSVLTLPQLIVSDAVQASAAVAAAEAAGSESAAASAGGAELAYVSLPPGTLPEMVSVRIVNAGTGESTPSIPVVEGGFDPVAVAAVPGHELELTFSDGGGTASVAHAVVPDRRAPVVVRTNPPRGRTDVALSIQPRVIFSEPIDPETLASGVRLTTGGTAVEASVALLPDEPWVAELVPASEMEPGTTYELQITTEVRDLDGDAPAEPVTIPFTTGTDPEVSGAPISGVVRAVHTDGQVTPVVGALVHIFVIERLGGRSYGYATTDDRGHYSHRRLPPSGRAIITASKDGYAQPCAAVHAYDLPGATHDLQLYTIAALTDPDVAPPPDQSPMVTGRVVDTRGSEPVPIAGARLFMDLFGGMGLVGATTWTNSNGEYFLCNLPQDLWGVVIQASAPGFSGFHERAVDAEDRELDFEFPIQ